MDSWGHGRRCQAGPRTVFAPAKPDTSLMYVGDGREENVA